MGLWFTERVQWHATVLVALIVRDPTLFLSSRISSHIVFSDRRVYFHPRSPSYTPSVACPRFASRRFGLCSTWTSCPIAGDPCPSPHMTLCYRSFAMIERLGGHSQLGPFILTLKQKFDTIRAFSHKPKVRRLFFFANNPR